MGAPCNDGDDGGHHHHNCDNGFDIPIVSGGAGNHVDAPVCIENNVDHSIFQSTSIDVHYCGGDWSGGGDYGGGGDCGGDGDYCGGDGDGGDGGGGGD